VIVLDHLSVTQRRALVLADNRIAANAGWDGELLKLEIAELDDIMAAMSAKRRTRIDNRAMELVTL
jgi:hypothetical protein